MCSWSSSRKLLPFGGGEVYICKTTHEICIQYCYLGASQVVLLIKNPPAAAAKSHQSCPTLCDPIDGNPPGSPIPGILQGGTLEWVAIFFSNAWKWKVKVKSLSLVRLWPHGLQPTRLLRPWDLPGKSTGVGWKNPPTNAESMRDADLIPGLGRSPGGGHGHPLQCSCLENPHGQRSLVGYDSEGCKELDMTEVT